MSWFMLNQCSMILPSRARMRSTYCTLTRCRWFRDGRVIAGAHDRTYKLTKASNGHRVSVRIKATRPGYVTAVSTSPGTVKIR